MLGRPSQISPVGSPDDGRIDSRTGLDCEVDRRDRSIPEESTDATRRGVHKPKCFGRADHYLEHGHSFLKQWKMSTSRKNSIWRSESAYTVQRLDWCLGRDWQMELGATGAR
jgi:hypothetical protein